MKFQLLCRYRLRKLVTSIEDTRVPHYRETATFVASHRSEPTSGSGNVVLTVDWVPVLETGHLCSCPDETEAAPLDHQDWRHPGQILWNVTGFGRIWATTDKWINLPGTTCNARTDI